MAASSNETGDHRPRSDDSGDEYERPNRWAGPPSTWQQMNGAEVETLTALNELRHRNLPVHLYNAFALKHRHAKGPSRDVVKPVPNQDINTSTGEPVKEDKWVPPRSWVAWPLPTDLVPHPQFMRRADSADEPFISRMPTQNTPKSDLEDAISSTILRIAKEKFQARQMSLRHGNAAGLDPDNNDDEGNETNVSSTTGSTRSRRTAASKSRSVKYESERESDYEMLDVDDVNAGERSSSAPPEPILLRPVVAADDELSHTLLRSSVQGILSKLDMTLTVLHNAQESRLNCPSDSDKSNKSDESSSFESHSSSSSREFSRDDSQLPDITKLAIPKSRLPRGPRLIEQPEAHKRRVGRPRKSYPRLADETDDAYNIRIARLQKKVLPQLAKVDGDGEPVSESTPAPASGAEDADVEAEAKHQVVRPVTKSRSRHNDSDAESDGTLADERTAKVRLKPANARLRDWRDILGAAALAGFPAPAIDRAARRCADLFGKKFSLHTLEEGAQNQARPMYYGPGMKMPSLLEESDDGDDEMPSQSQTSDTMPRRAPVPYEHFCFVSGCPRSLEPFTRRPNLLRHIRLMHNYGEDDIPVVETGSEDEMHGAVHVDGYLKPIKIRRGWRPEGAAKDKRRPRTRPRKRAKAKAGSHEMKGVEPAGSQ